MCPWLYLIIDDVNSTVWTCATCWRELQPNNGNQASKLGFSYNHCEPGSCTDELADYLGDHAVQPIETFELTR